MRPLQVYLDSSDFSTLSNPQALAANPQLPVIRDSLLAFAEAGQVQYRFSGIHVVEITHTTADARAHALRRAEMIERLCGRNAMRHVYNLFVLDGAYVCASKRREGAPTCFPDYAFSNDGEWFPHLGNLGRDLETAMQRDILTVLKEKRVSRHDRRVWNRKLFRNGRPTLEFRELAAANVQEFDDGLEASLPLTERFYREQYGRKLACGEITAEEFAAEAIRGVCDVRNFVGWYIDRLEKGREIVGIFRNIGEDLYRAMQGVRQQLEDFRDRFGGYYMDEKERRAQIAKFLRGQQIHFRRRMLQVALHGDEALLGAWRVSREVWKKTVLDDDSLELPSVGILLDVYTEYAKRVVSLSGKVDTSDWPDIMHAVYVPYVDVFRADTRTAEFIKPIAQKRGYRVVRLLEDLPGEIRNALGERRER